MFGADFCYRRLPEVLDPFDKAAFESSPMEFFLVCTDVVSGKPVYRRCCKADRNCMDWMRASASMPLVSSLVRIDGRSYLDGAITDSIPLHFMEQKGYQKNIVILTQPEGYVKKALSLQWLLDILYRKYPELRKAMTRRHILYNGQLEYVQKRRDEGAVLIVRPEQTLGIRHITHDPALLQETYETGRRTAERQLDRIRSFMASERRGADFLQLQRIAH